MNRIETIIGQILKELTKPDRSTLIRCFKYNVNKKRAPNIKTKAQKAIKFMNLKELHFHLTRSIQIL